MTKTNRSNEFNDRKRGHVMRKVLGIALASPESRAIGSEFGSTWNSVPTYGTQLDSVQAE